MKLNDEVDDEVEVEVEVDLFDYYIIHIIIL